jgi:hypothetical protein
VFPCPSGPVHTQPLALLDFVYVEHDAFHVEVPFWLATLALALAFSRRSVKPR